MKFEITTGTGAEEKEPTTKLWLEHVPNGIGIEGSCVVLKSELANGSVRSEVIIYQTGRKKLIKGGNLEESP